MWTYTWQFFYSKLYDMNIYMCHVLYRILQILLKFNNLALLNCKQNLTSFDVTRRTAPRGIKAIPIAKKAGNTVPAVKMGCQAGSLCCFNFVSEKYICMSMTKCIYICMLLQCFEGPKKDWLCQKWSPL